MYELLEHNLQTLEHARHSLLRQILPCPTKTQHRYVHRFHYLARQEYLSTTEKMPQPVRPLRGGTDKFELARLVGMKRKAVSAKV